MTMRIDPNGELANLGQFLLDNEVICLSIRPPQAEGEGWTANYRKRPSETAWTCGQSKPTLEEAVMSVFGKLETLLESRKISHVSMGRSALPGGGRFATLESGAPDFANARGKGDTLEAAVEDALAQVEKKVGQAIPEAKVAPATPAPQPVEEDDDPLADLLG